MLKRLKKFAMNQIQRKKLVFFAASQLIPLTISVSQSFFPFFPQKKNYGKKMQQMEQEKKQLDKIAVERQKYLEKEIAALADLGGGAQGRAPPPLGQIFFIFMQFLGKIGQIVCWRPPPLGLAPPRLGNPGSATEQILKNRGVEKLSPGGNTSCSKDYLAVNLINILGKNDVSSLRLVSKQFQQSMTAWICKA